MPHTASPLCIVGQPESVGLELVVYLGEVGIGLDDFLRERSLVVATGIPGGICTIASRASMPSKVELIGTPITGTVVIAAITPGR